MKTKSSLAIVATAMASHAMSSNPVAIDDITQDDICISIPDNAYQFMRTLSDLGIQTDLAAYTAAMRDMGILSHAVIITA